MKQDLMKGVIDMHVHTNPDLRLRAYDDFELMEAAIRVGARAIVIKTHQGTTMDRAYLCNRHNEIVHGNTNNFTMYGSITLNRVVGGDQSESRRYRTSSWSKSCLAPDTVRKKSHAENGPGSEPVRGSRKKTEKSFRELRSVLELVRDHNAVLGTAHIAPDEIFTVVEAARDLGVKNIVITHPEWWIVGMSHEDQLRLVKDYNVILERCYAQNMGGGKYKSNLADNLEIIKEIGYRNVMVDTDGGQTENPHWELALAEYMQYLVDHGIPEEHVYHMTHTIPASLLGINEQEESAC